MAPPPAGGEQPARGQADRAHIAQFGSPLAVVANIARGALCARPGHLLFSADLRMIESRVLAWVAGDERKLALYEDPAHRWINDQP